MTNEPCTHKPGDVARIGDIDVSPHIYRAVEVHHNVSVCVSRCVHCGEVSITWSPDPDTFALDEEDIEEGSRT